MTSISMTKEISYLGDQLGNIYIVSNNIFNKLDSISQDNMA